MKTQECWDTTGSPPISTQWVDVNKGDQQDYDIRCRLVAREMGGAKSDEFDAPTPPLEANRLLFSEAATNRRFGKHEKKLPSSMSGRPTSMRRLTDPRLLNYLLRCNGPAIAAGYSGACMAPREPPRSGRRPTVEPSVDSGSSRARLLRVASHTKPES